MIREHNGQKFFLAIISSGRPHNVKKMTSQVGEATWIVPKDQIAEYEENGAQATDDGGSLVNARNKALELAFSENIICVQMDDDLSKMSRTIDGEAAIDIDAKDAIAEIVQRLRISDFCLAGASPTANPYFISKRTSTNLFVIGSFIAVKPSEPRFDPDFKLKEDFAYTIEHILLYGGVLRCDDILPTFLHYTNEGGCKDIRTDELELEACELLLDKYPGLVRKHPRRKNEIMINIKKNYRV